MVQIYKSGGSREMILNDSSSSKRLEINAHVQHSRYQTPKNRFNFVQMKYIFLLFILGCTQFANACNWNNVNASYSDSCNKFSFEVSGTVDTCFKVEAKIYSGTVLKATYNHRIFSHYFQDTGHYVVRFKVLNTCTNCDTIIYKPIYNGCNPSFTSCNWSKANISFSQNCNILHFELGSLDTCFTYQTLALRNGHLDTLASSRVFTHTFSDTGTYIIRTAFHNKCNGCDTVIYKSLYVGCRYKSEVCNWSKANISFTKNCNKVTFEMGSKDSCFTYKTLTIRNGNIDTISYDRVFSHTFSDTGTYIIRTTFHNKCNGCDTVIYKEVHISCLASTTSCNWSKANIGYSQNCNKLTFEMGSKDTCLKYKTLAIRNGHTDTLSDDRVFMHSFSDTGRYVIRTTFHNQCNGCDTVIYREVHITCLTAGIEDLSFLSNSIEIYPNPATSRVTLRTANMAVFGPLHLSLTTLLGEKIEDKMVTSEETEINVSLLPPGLYIISLTNEMHALNYKIVVSR
jgi:hypothetical protein